MLFDRIVLIGAWIAAAVLLAFAIPKHGLRDAAVVFMCKQVITWPLGLLVVQYGLLAYPVRDFPQATLTSFSFEYFIYPATCVAFTLRFPETRGIWAKLGWYLLFPTWMTALEVAIERYTNLVRYVHWSWHWTWLTLLITFHMTRMFYLWFIQKGVPAAKGGSNT